MKMIRYSLLAVGLMLLSAACGSSQKSVVSSSKARALRIYVHAGSEFTETDEDCRLHYATLRQTLPFAVRAKLLDAGFTVVNDSSEPHDLDAVVTGHFTYCKESGSCVNGSANVDFYRGGVVYEHYTYDTGDERCQFAPTVDEYPQSFVEDMGQHLRGSDRIASLDPGAASRPHGPAPAPAASVAQARPTLSAPAASARRYVQGAPQPHAYALVIGIERYRDVPSPSGARADARGFAGLAKKTLGIPPENVRLLLDDRASKGDIDKQLAWIEANVPKGGRVYFFYSGHGAPDPSRGTPYIVPYDGDPSALEQTAIPLADLTARLERTRAAESIAFLDACFSGAGGRSLLPPGARPLVRVESAPLRANVVVLASSSGAEISGPAADGSGGLFSKYVIEGIGAGRADLDGDRQITLAELSSWVSPRVVREARRANRHQTPALSVGDGKDAGAVVVAFGVQQN